MPGRHGVEVVVDSLIPYLVEMGHDVTVYGYASYTEATDDYYGAKIKVVSGSSGKNTAMISHMWNASVDVRRESFDIVHIHNTDPCLLAWLPKARHGVVATSHGQAYVRGKWSFPAKSMSRLAERFFIHLPDVITSVSKPLAEYYESKYKKKVLYIPNGIKLREKPDESYIKKWNIEPQNYLFCSAGRIEKTKGIHTLLDAYRKLDTDIPLIIAGGGSGTDPGYFSELKNNCPEGAQFVGFLSGDEYYSLYAHARIFIFPSEYEAMSMALLEGISFGTPTIYSNIPENEAVAKGLGYSFEVSNPESLTRQIENVLTHYEEAIMLGRKAEETIKDKHDWGAIARQYNDIYAGMKALKIAFVGLRGVPAVYGGVDKVVEEIGTGLAERGHKVFVYCWKSIYEEHQDEYKKMKLVYLPTIPVKYLGTLIHTFLGCISAVIKDVDVVHINNIENAIFAFIPRLFGKKVVVQPHGPAWPVLKWGTIRERFFFNFKIILSRMFTDFCRFPTIMLSDKIVVISGTDARYISGKKLDKFALIHNGCDIPESFSPDKMLDLGITPQKYLLFVGRLDPRKGCHYLIKAFRELKTDYTLVIAGGPLDGSYGKYLKRIAGNDERIKLLGPIYDSCLNELYSNALVYIHPSESEGQSIALLEGLAYGNCVVTSDTPESIETAADKACYFKAGDWKDLHRVLEELIDQPAKIDEMRIATRSYVEQYYRWDDKVLKYEDLYSSLIDRNKNSNNNTNVSKRHYINKLVYSLTIANKSLYYLLKPVIPRNLQLFLRSRLIKYLKKQNTRIWPIDEAARKPPEQHSGWPENKKFAVILTHDVETDLGSTRSQAVADIEKEFGFRSSFNFVPEKYKVDPALRKQLIDSGFEVGVHGLNHDGKLFKSRKIFQDRAGRINNFLKEWDAAGFRAPAMHHNLEWIGELDIEYDSSTFDTDPFEPQPDAVGTIFPFWVNGRNDKKGYVELPYTLAQDFTLFVIMKERTIDIWKRKLDWIAEHGGMALVITHPDYMHFGDGKKGIEEYSADLYKEFLEYIKDQYEGQYWHVLPKEMARFWVSDVVKKNDKNVKDD